MQTRWLLGGLLISTAAMAEPMTDLTVPVPPATTAAARAQSRTIYLNRNGVTLTPGVNDSRANTSSLITQPAEIPAWNASASLWADTVSCLRDTFAPFDVTVTETDPGATPHIEAVFGGHAALLGLPVNAAGVSPMRTDCGVIENSIVFTFADAIPQKAEVACAVMAQEIAHSYGLDHELLAPDPMSYLPYSGQRAFQDQVASCGESTPRPCACGPNQSSYQVLLARLGAAGTGDIDAPSLAITSPSDGAVVAPGFLITADISDDVAVTDTTLSIDGTVVASRSVAPWKFGATDDLAPGPHSITIAASDGTNTSTQTVTIDVESPPDVAQELGCSAGGNSSWLVALAVLGLVRRRRR
jgi:MYXO-CTERM domain-containing protein